MLLFKYYTNRPMSSNLYLPYKHAHKHSLIFSIWAFYGLRVDLSTSQNMLVLHAPLAKISAGAHAHIYPQFVKNSTNIAVTK